MVVSFTTTREVFMISGTAGSSTTPSMCYLHKADFVRVLFASAATECELLEAVFAVPDALVALLIYNPS